MRQPYLIYKKTVREKKHYYVKLWDEKTYSYSVRKSVRAIKDELGPKGLRFPHTSKAGADALVQLWLKDKPKELTQERFDQYLLCFWEEDSDFLKGQALRGHRYSVTYRKNNLSGIKKYFLPYLDDVKKRSILLHQVKPGLLESFLYYMSDKGAVGEKRINDILQAVTVALAEAHRLGKIQNNPGEKVRKLKTTSTERAIFSMEEARQFFELNTELLFYGINLLAATTGLRLGECRGLLKGDIFENYIDVAHNWQDNEKIKDPKWGSKGRVPIPHQTREILEQLIHENPYGNEFVFWGKEVDEPVSKDDVANNFNIITEDKMKIKDRKARMLSFQSWRHYYNSNLRGKIPDHLLRELTRHSSEEMTDRYTHLTAEQIEAVSELADKII